uniref:SFRICE_036924 n=1 Tax=Spodoptera frugiperda TaxID=7108 RepID=A0A2H1V4H8_SPOFR
MDKSLSDTNISATMDTTPPNFVSTRNKRLREEDLPEEFSKFRSEIKEMFSSFILTQQNEMKIIKDIQITNINIETAVTHLTKQNDEFRKKIESLESQRKKDREYIALLEERIEDMNRCNRKTCIEIKNVPKQHQENSDDLINMVTNLGRHLSIEIDSRDVRDIHRLPSKKEGIKNTPVVVELNSTLLKTNLLKKAKSFNIKNTSKLQAKHLGIKSDAEVPVFISEQLTPKNARLFFLARDLAKTKQYKFCWTSFGRIMVKKDENARNIVIKSEAQVQHLMQEA